MIAGLGNYLFTNGHRSPLSSHCVTSRHRLITSYQIGIMKTNHTKKASRTNDVIPPISAFQHANIAFHD